MRPGRYVRQMPADAGDVHSYLAPELVRQRFSSGTARAAWPAFLAAGRHF